MNPVTKKVKLTSSDDNNYDQRAIKSFFQKNLTKLFTILMISKFLSRRKHRYTKKIENFKAEKKHTRLKKL